MPQLEQVSTFPSQVIWLLITFAVLYFLLWRVVLPKISATLENRGQRIANDFARAEELAAEAEGVLAAYEEELAKARSSAQEELHKAAETANAEAEARNAALTEKLSANADAANARIDDARKAAIGNISDVAEDLARTAVERLVDTTPDPSTVNAAVASALGERQ
jgi:F-type H+-transporting ATPase subunit b